MNAPKLYLLLVVALLAACAPVNRLTRLTEIPREHSMNYCATDLKAPKSVLNKSAWVVYSDRDNNVSYRKPGSRHKQKDLNFMEAFLVIGQRRFSAIDQIPTGYNQGRPTDRFQKQNTTAGYTNRMLLSPGRPPTQATTCPTSIFWP